MALNEILMLIVALAIAAACIYSGWKTIKTKKFYDGPGRNITGKRAIKYGIFAIALGIAIIVFNLFPYFKQLLFLK